MDSRRQQKIGNLIKETFSEILQRQGSVLYGNRTLVTVTTVNTSPDLSIAKIYLSIFNAPEDLDVIEIIRDHTNELRGELGNKLRHSLRKIPELHFFEDDSLEQAERISQIFKDLNKDSES